MSTDTICQNCKAEFDTRHPHCPSCTIDVELRDAAPPHETITAKGLIPFTMHGELFAVTEIVTPLNTWQKWRVTHVTTGCKVTQGSETPQKAKEAGIAFLQNKSSEAVQKAIETVKAKFPKSQ